VLALWAVSAGAGRAEEVAAATPAPAPAIALIIDDLGNQLAVDTRVARLPGAVTCAILPYTPHARRMAELAHRLDKEVMLHLPMQPIEAGRLDDGGLTAAMSREEFVAAVRRGLSSLPYVSGVNNHMGSLLTQSPARMQWLMEELRRHAGLYFVDSYTTFRSIAYRVAADEGVPTARRDVFLDAERGADFIRAQFERLIARARRNGTAVAIAHPYAGTLDFLERELAALPARGVVLLPVSRLLERRAADRPRSALAAAAGRWTQREAPAYAGIPTEN
jgi:polysaccharide deacetylase 2 family uncharacterized protein YibQ